jgi:hypothetical protein
MAAKKRPHPAPPAEGLPKIYEATRASGPSGAVIQGAEIDLAAAVERRRAGEDIVVCGGPLKANRKLAREIESAVGPCERQEPHAVKAGNLALPHFQQTDRTTEGHSFYETDNRKAKANP